MIAFWAIVLFAKLIHNALFLFPAIFIGIIGMAYGNDSLRVGFSLMLVPNIRMFDGVGTTFLVNIMLFIPLIAKILTERRVNSKALLHTVILASMELLHIFAEQNYGSLVPNMVTILMLLYVETVLTDRRTFLDFNKITRMFAFGCIYSAVAYFLTNAWRRDLSIYFKGLGFRYQGYASDPNYFSLYMCLAVALLFIIRVHAKRDLIYIFALIFIELFTLSKMALVLLILTALYFIGKAVWHGFHGRLRFVKYILIAGIGLAVLFSNRIVTLLEVTINRLQEHNGTAVNIDTITSGRNTLVGFYFDTLGSDPLMILFGHGLQYNTLYERSLSHNTLFDIILSWGIVGLVVMFFIFYTIFKTMVHNCPERVTLDHLFPSFILLLTFFALSCLSASMFWWVVLAALLPLKGIQNENDPAYLRNRSGIQRRTVRSGVY